ncbi:MAG: T9SS type A sorting domain-containing protein, partial [Bacteroidota bacterium]|nr:T9SS type A sorting domain-containing protein [Bacteroidota bacterium]
SDADGDEITIVDYEYHGSGNVSLNNDSTAIHYVPLYLDDTPDTIRYFIEDIHGAGDTAMVFIHLYRLMEGLYALDNELEGLSHGAIKWGDYDDDGDLDILQTGWTGTSMEFRTKIITNTGEDEFEDSGIQFLGVSAGTSSSAEWIDFDNDNDLDICVAGRMDGDASIFKVLIYENEGGSFSHYTHFDFTGTTSCSMSWGDVNLDGKKDMFITGAVGESQKAWVYMGKGDDGSGWMFEKTEPEIQASQNGEVSLTDVDLDGDLDFFICGGNIGVSRIWLQQEEALEEIVSGVPDFTNAAAEWADFDADGDPDLAIMGRSNDEYKCQIYENTGLGKKNGTLLSLYQEFEGMEGGDIAWADFDNNGEIDLAVTGNDDILHSVTKILFNDDGVFSEENYALAGIGRSSLAWGDYDNDGDPDLALQGIDMTNSQTIIYRNDCESINSPPVIIGNTSSSKESNRYTISWEPATDDITPQKSLSYNVRLGTSSKGTDIISPMSVNGFLKTPQIGNAGYNTFIELPVLEPGEYYFGIQAIDQSFAASGFTMDAYLVITGIEDQTGSPDFEMYPNPASDRIWISPNEKGRYQLQIIDLTGRSVISKIVDIHADNFELDISQLQSGTYMVLLSTDEKVERRKLIVR